MACDLEPRDPVSELGRQRKLDNRALLAAFKNERGTGKLARRSAGIEAMRGNGDFGGAGWPAAQAFHRNDAILKPGWFQTEDRSRRFENGNGSVRLKPCEKRGAPAPVQPIGQPKRIETAFELFRPALDVARCRRPGLRVQPGQFSDPTVRRAEYERRVRRQIGGHHDACLAARARGIEKRRLGAFHPARPVRRVGPGAVDEDQKRSAGVTFDLGVQDRARKADDRGGNGEHPQQEQPPGRAVGLAFVVLQPQKQRHAGKPPPDRRGRHGAQQKPEQRQQDEPQKQPGGGKSYGADAEHQCARSIAP